MSRMPCSISVCACACALAVASLTACSVNARWDGALEACTDAQLDDAPVSLVVVDGDVLLLTTVGVAEAPDGSIVTCSSSAEPLEDPAALTFTATQTCNTGDVALGFDLSGGDTSQSGTVTIERGDDTVTCDLTMSRAGAGG